MKLTIQNPKSKILALVASVLLIAPVASVWGTNIVDIECDSCQTVTDFENAALSDYPNNGEVDFYYVVNFSAGLVGKIKLAREYEPEVHKWIPNNSSDYDHAS